MAWFVGGYDKEEKAARSYDLAALKYWGPTATTNFPVRVTSLFSFQCTKKSYGICYREEIPLN